LPVQVCLIVFKTPLVELSFGLVTLSEHFFRKAPLSYVFGKLTPEMMELEPPGLLLLGIKGAVECFFLRKCFSRIFVDENF